MNISFRTCVVAMGMLAVNLSAQTLVDLRNQSKRGGFFDGVIDQARTGLVLPGTCSVGEVFFQTAPGANLYACVDVNTWTATGRRIPITAIADLPTTCVMGELNFVTDAAVFAGGWNLYTCNATNTWAQAGVQADGTGYLIVTCASPSSCLVGPNLSVLPTLTGPNTFLGSSDFSGASKTAPFRLAATAPVSCDATTHETYYNTTSNIMSLCTAADTWTPVPTLPGINAWSGTSDFSAAGKTAMFRLAGTAPATCDAASREAYFNTTANTLNLCTATNVWTAVPSLAGTNSWAGTADFSGASKTAMFRLAATAPATCDAASREAYFNTTANTLNLCTATNVWTAVPSLAGTNSWAGTADFSGASKTAMFRLAATAPATCDAASREAYFNTTANTLNLCTATNVWTAVPSLAGTNSWAGTADFSGASKTAMFRLAATAPATCDAASREAYFNTTANTLNLCTATNVWTAVPSLAGTNSWAGTADFSGASKTAMFRLAATAPATCDAASREAYFNTTANTLNLCTATNTWTSVPSLAGVNAWTGAADFSAASKTAMFRLASSAPGTCDATAREAYFDTTTNVPNFCTSTNTWTPVAGAGGGFLLYQNTGIAPVTATGSAQTLDSFLIPAGKLRAGDLIEIEATFVRTGTAAPLTFGVSFGGAAMQAVATPTTSTSAVFKPRLTVAGPASEVWSGAVLIDGVAPVVIASTANSTVNVATPITVALTQNGTGPDTGAVLSWSVKVTR